MKKITHDMDLKDGDIGKKWKHMDQSWYHRMDYVFCLLLLLLGGLKDGAYFACTSIDSVGLSRYFLL